MATETAHAASGFRHQQGQKRPCTAAGGAYQGNIQSRRGAMYRQRRAFVGHRGRCTANYATGYPARAGNTATLATGDGLG